MKTKRPVEHLPEEEEPRRFRRPIGNPNENKGGQSVLSVGRTAVAPPCDDVTAVAAAVPAVAEDNTTTTTSTSSAPSPRENN